MTYATSNAARRFLFGASNLTRSFPTVVATVRATWCEPIEIMAAMGHGRSYGQDSSVFGRKISGIFPCALWQDLQNRPTAANAALVTDIGNDLLYGVTPDRLLRMGRAMPRSTRRGRRGDDRHANADREHRTTERSDGFDSFGGCFFRAARSRWPTRKRARSRNQRTARLSWASREKSR